MPDWCLLPGELLHIISEKLEDGFDVIHARSVCTLWRSIFPFPSYMLSRTRYSLPSFAVFPHRIKALCTLEKIPLFLLYIPPVTTATSVSECFLLGRLGRVESGDHIQCSKVNIHDSLILPLGHQYRMIFDQEAWNGLYRGVAFLPLNKEGGGEFEFVVLVNYTNMLLELTSSVMKWRLRLQVSSNATCEDLVAFRGRFYAAFYNGDVLIFDPYSLVQTPLTPSQPLTSNKYLVRSGDDELFLVEIYNPHRVFDSNRFICRVSRLDEEAGRWVVVTELGDRVFFIGHFGNVCCSAKKLPYGCGVSGNSIVFTNGRRNVTCAYKYGVHTGREEDDLNCWRFSRENRVTIISTSPMVALRIERLSLSHKSNFGYLRHPLLKIRSLCI